MPAKPQGFSVFLATASVALAALVLVLVFQNRALRRALALHETQAASKNDARFVEGERVPPLGLLARDGSVESLAFDGSGAGTLLLFYAQACNVCPQVFLSWEQLVPQVEADGVRVAAVQLDRTASGAEHGPPDIASFALADLSSVPLAKLATVPLTLLVDARGVVRWARYGTLTEADLGELVALLPLGA